MHQPPGSHDIVFIARRWPCKIAFGKDSFQLRVQVQLSIAGLGGCVKVSLQITPGTEIVALSLSSHPIYIFRKN